MIIPPSDNDTICAIATPPGVGGIAVIRISGFEAIKTAQKLWNGKSLTRSQTHTAHLGRIIDPVTGETIDEAVATVYRAPRSFTGQDTVELSIHGSRWLQSHILGLLTGQPRTRLAEPGEFTRRAFVNGRIDLTQAEAVADLIGSRSQAAARLAISQMRGAVSQRLASLRQQLIDLSALLELELDFSEEDVEFADRTKLIKTAGDIHDEIAALLHSFSAGQAMKNGIPVAIIGPTNAGKSSLLNILLGDNRAIVSEIHGTTRDIIEDTLHLGGYEFRLMDTAGLRRTDDTIEALGIERTREAAESAAILLIVVDATAPLPDLSQMPSAPHTILLLNKTDLPGARPHADIADGTTVISISAKTGTGLDTLRQALVNAAQADGDSAGETLITNRRHAEALAEALAATEDTLAALDMGLSGDLVAQHLRLTLHHLGTITGAITTPEILSAIFSRFCIGK